MAGAAAGYRGAVTRTYTDEGVVLRTHKLGEADRIVTVFTRRTGLVRAVGKGVRRTSSRFGSRLEPFSRVDLQLHEGRGGLDTVTQAVTRDPFGLPISADYRLYTAGTAVLETAERLAGEERQPAPDLYLMLVGALRSLAGRAHDPSLVLDAFLLRALGLAGYQAALTDCAGCGTPGPHGAFSVSAGGAVCAVCKPAGAANPAPLTLDLLRALQGGDWTGADASDARSRREASGYVAAFLQFHLERGLRSLPHVERV